MCVLDCGPSFASQLEERTEESAPFTVGTQGTGVMGGHWASRELDSGLDAGSGLLWDPGLTLSSPASGSWLYRREEGRESLTGDLSSWSQDAGRTESLYLPHFLYSCIRKSDLGDMPPFRTHPEGFLSPLLFRLNFSEIQYSDSWTGLRCHPKMGV